GTSATWTKLAAPPRTQGHAYNIYVLNDGTLVASYSARIAANDFQPSSGVFVSTNDGTNWVDRSASGMQYYTKDLTIDPNDPISELRPPGPNWRRLHARKDTRITSTCSTTARWWRATRRALPPMIFSPARASLSAPTTARTGWTAVRPGCSTIRRT